MASPTFGLFFMVVAYGLYQPTAYAGVKRYTNPKTATMGYAVIYALMNLGAFLSGAISSNTRPLFESVFAPNGLTGVFWIYFAITILACLSTILLITKKVDQNAVTRVDKESKELVANSEQKESKQEPAVKKQTEKVNNGLFVFYLFLYNGTRS